ncbi:hypothetical protein ABES80_13170 [Bacillus gobiensis]|uniref:hypothetical protein n=1 Tax=Bacillus gobiensis TaxID=1441095 RepID=UPI003D1B1240
MNENHNKISIEKLKSNDIELEGLSIDYFNDIGTTSNNTKEAGEKNFLQLFIESKFSPPIVSAVISATISISLYFLGRKYAKNQLIFDVALKHLLPTVYMPLIAELRSHKDKKTKIDFHKIEKIIMENAALINFAPKNIKILLGKILSTCRKITGEDEYTENKTFLCENLEKLEAEIIKRFGALVG